MLKGLLTCGCCGRNFFVHKRADLSDNQYVCSSGRYTGEFCGTRGIGIPYLDNLVWSSVVHMDKEIQEFYRRYEADDMTKKHQVAFDKLQSQLKDIKRKIDNVVDLGAERAIPKNNRRHSLKGSTRNNNELKQSLNKQGSN